MELWGPIDVDDFIVKSFIAKEIHSIFAQIVSFDNN
jgi:hypothetical protein